MASARTKPYWDHHVVHPRPAKSSWSLDPTGCRIWLGAYVVTMVGRATGGLTVGRVVGWQSGGLRVVILTRYMSQLQRRKVAVFRKPNDVLVIRPDMDMDLATPRLLSILDE